MQQEYTGLLSFILHTTIVFSGICQRHVKMNRTRYLLKLAHDYLEFRLPVSVISLIETKGHIYFRGPPLVIRLFFVTQWLKCRQDGTVILWLKCRPDGKSKHSINNE